MVHVKYSCIQIIFLNETIQNKNNIKIIFSLPFFEYNEDYYSYRGLLDYAIFDNLDILIIENNNLDDKQNLSKKIINYCKNKNMFNKISNLSNKLVRYV